MRDPRSDVRHRTQGGGLRATQRRVPRCKGGMDKLEARGEHGEEEGEREDMQDEVRILDRREGGGDRGGGDDVGIHAEHDGDGEQHRDGNTTDGRCHPEEQILLDDIDEATFDALIGNPHGLRCFVGGAAFGPTCCAHSEARGAEERMQEQRPVREVRPGVAEHGEGYDDGRGVQCDPEVPDSAPREACAGRMLHAHGSAATHADAAPPGRARVFLHNTRRNRDCGTLATCDSAALPPSSRCFAEMRSVPVDYARTGMWPLRDKTLLHGVSAAQLALQFTEVDSSRRRGGYGAPPHLITNYSSTARSAVDYTPLWEPRVCVSRAEAEAGTRVAADHMRGSGGGGGSGGGALSDAMIREGLRHACCVLFNTARARSPAGYSLYGTPLVRMRAVHENFACTGTRRALSSDSVRVRVPVAWLPHDASTPSAYVVVLGEYNPRKPPGPPAPGTKITPVVRWAKLPARSPEMVTATAELTLKVLTDSECQGAVRALNLAANAATPRNVYHSFTHSDVAQRDGPSPAFPRSARAETPTTLSLDYLTEITERMTAQYREMLSLSEPVCSFPWYVKVRAIMKAAAPTHVALWTTECLTLGAIVALRGTPAYAILEACEADVAWVRVFSALLSDEWASPILARWAAAVGVEEVDPRVSTPRTYCTLVDSAACDIPRWHDEASGAWHPHADDEPLRAKERAPGIDAAYVIAQAAPGATTLVDEAVAAAALAVSREAQSPERDAPIPTRIFRVHFTAVPSMINTRGVVLQKGYMYLSPLQLMDAFRASFKRVLWEPLVARAEQALAAKSALGHFLAPFGPDWREMQKPPLATPGTVFTARSAPAPHVSAASYDPADDAPAPHVSAASYDPADDERSEALGALFRDGMLGAMATSRRRHATASTAAYAIQWDSMAELRAHAPPCILALLSPPSHAKKKHPGDMGRLLLRSFAVAAGLPAMTIMEATRATWVADGALGKLAAELKRAQGIDNGTEASKHPSSCTNVQLQGLCPMLNSEPMDIEELYTAQRSARNAGAWAHVVELSTAQHGAAAACTACALLVRGVGAPPCTNPCFVLKPGTLHASLPLVVET